MNHDELIHNCSFSISFFAAMFCAHCGCKVDDDTAVFCATYGKRKANTLDSVLETLNDMLKYTISPSKDIII